MHFSWKQTNCGAQRALLRSGLQPIKAEQMELWITPILPSDSTIPSDSLSDSTFPSDSTISSD